MKNTLFFHVWAPNIYGTSSIIYLIMFLTVISKVVIFNITQRYTNSLVQLLIFLIFVGTYRLSSNARLEAFVIQTKLNQTRSFGHRKNPPYHPARSNRHHLHQPHKEPTPQPRSYWSTCYSTPEKVQPTCNQIRNKNHAN